MEGETKSPLDCVVAIHNLESKHIPRELIKLIVEYAVPIMYCKMCGFILQRNYSRSNPLAWVISNNKVKCNRCHPSLNKLWLRHKYPNRFKKNIG
jgi:hypothetical protein